ncbi:hypothetical protein F5I97DRAFT_1777941, partial [Phlebopus sp. FC_14]
QHSQYHPHTLSTLLPTPPSSPPTIGLHPVESTISLLESLVAFYHQERMWVYRTRAQLEMGLMQRVELADTNGSGPGQSGSEGGADGQGDTSNRSMSKSPSTENGDTPSPSPPTKWLKRKKAFGLRLEGLPTTRGVVPSVARESHAPSASPVIASGARDPSVQILEMFESMMQARMESCERVTRMVRGANSPGNAAGVDGTLDGRMVG